MKKKTIDEFGEKYRRARDGDLTPRDAWSNRIRGTSNEETCQIWSQKSFEVFSIEDFKEMLLRAAQNEHAIVVNINFRAPSMSDLAALEKKLTHLIASLPKAGFKQEMYSVQLTEQAVGFISLPLYTEGELPGVFMQGTAAIH